MELDAVERTFARWLDAGTRFAFVLLAAGFIVYVTGWLPPLVPVSELPKLWGLPLAQFVAATGAPTGWDWLAYAGHGDYFNYIGLALLTSIVIAAYMRVLPLLARRERAFAFIAALEIVVLFAAASGLLNFIGGG